MPKTKKRRKAKEEKPDGDLDLADRIKVANMAHFILKARRDDNEDNGPLE
jgi:hypothetical protein